MFLYTVGLMLGDTIDTDAPIAPTTPYAVFEPLFHLVRPACFAVFVVGNPAHTRLAITTCFKTRLFRNWTLANYLVLRVVYNLLLRHNNKYLIYVYCIGFYTDNNRHVVM